MPIVGGKKYPYTKQGKRVTKAKGGKVNKNK